MTPAPDEPLTPKGPPLPDEEDVFRRLSPAWCEGGRISSQAFSWPRFSVDRARMITPAQSLPEEQENEGFKLSVFNCGVARELGFDTRDEPDENFPENKAHAHVYCVHKHDKRKKQAKKLAEKASLIETGRLRG